MDAMHQLRTAIGEVEPRAAEIVTGNVLKAASLAFPSQKVGNGSAAAFALRGCVHEFNNAIRVGVRQRLEKHRVDDREDSAVDADAERQGRDRETRESRVSAEHAHCVFEIVPEITHRLCLSRTLPS